MRTRPAPPLPPHGHPSSVLWLLSPHDTHVPVPIPCPPTISLCPRAQLLPPHVPMFLCSSAVLMYPCPHIHARSPRAPTYPCPSLVPPYPHVSPFVPPCPHAHLCKKATSTPRRLCAISMPNSGVIWGARSTCARSSCGHRQCWGWGHGHHPAVPRGHGHHCGIPWGTNNSTIPLGHLGICMGYPGTLVSLWGAQ